MLAGDCTLQRPAAPYDDGHIFTAAQQNSKGKNKAGATNLGYVAPTHGNGHCPHPSNRLGIWIHRMPELAKNINLSAPGMQLLSAKNFHGHFWPVFGRKS